MGVGGAWILTASLCPQDSEEYPRETPSPAASPRPGALGHEAPEIQAQEGPGSKGPKLGSDTNTPGSAPTGRAGGSQVTGRLQGQAPGLGHRGAVQDSPPRDWCTVPTPLQRAQWGACLSLSEGGPAQQVLVSGERECGREPWLSGGGCLAGGWSECGGGQGLAQWGLV